MNTSRVPTDIRYPTDVGLLNEAREKSERIIDRLHAPLKGKEKKVRTYRKKARREYLRVAKKRKVSAKELRKGIGKQLRYLRRDLQHREHLAETSGSIIALTFLVMNLERLLKEVFLHFYKEWILFRYFSLLMAFFVFYV